MDQQDVSQAPGVSIVIPSHNYDRFLGEAIESALAQTHPLVEVIVVDDGSTDDSRRVIERYAGRITAVLQANAGQTRACAEGFRRSRHPIVVFLDADDRLAPDAAAIAAADWPTRAAKRQFRLRVIDEASMGLGHLFPKYARDLAPATIRAELLRTGYYPCPPTSGNAWARTFLEAIWPFDAHAFVDSVLNTLAPLYGEVHTSAAVLGDYRLHGANAYAGGAMDAERFAGHLAADEARIAILQRHCHRLGVPFAGRTVLGRLLSYREHALVVAKLRAATLRDHGAVLRAAGATVAAGWRQPQRPHHRLLRALWAIAVALLPQAAARALITLRFVPAARAATVRRLLGPIRRWSPSP